MCHVCVETSGYLKYDPRGSSPCAVSSCFLSGGVVCLTQRFFKFIDIFRHITYFVSFFSTHKYSCLLLCCLGSVPRNLSLLFKLWHLFCLSPVRSPVYTYLLIPTQGPYPPLPNTFCPSWRPTPLFVCPHPHSLVTGYHWHLPAFQPVPIGSEAGWTSHRRSWIGDEEKNIFLAENRTP